MCFLPYKCCQTAGWGVVLSLLFSCNEPPSPVGAEFLPDTAELKTLSSADTLLIAAAFTERVQQPIFNVGTLFVGRFQDMEARTLLRFTDIPDSLPYVTAADILQATIVLTPERYALGDTSAGATHLSFQVTKVLRLWSPKSTWDSLFAAGDAGVIDPLELGRWEGNIPLRDTAEPVRVELNEAGRQLIAEWLRFQADSTLRQQIYGIALLPTLAMTAIRAFATQAVGRLERPAPQLQVAYRRRDNVIDTLRLTAGYAGSFISPPQADTTRLLVLQPGVQYAPRLHIRLDALPATAAIHRAELRLWADTTTYWTSNYGRLRTLTLTPTDSGVPSWIGATATYDAASSSFISKSLAPILEHWLRRGRRGTLSISLPATDLYSRLDRITLERSGSRAPLLVILYSARRQP
ncbi:MAG: hypothetical protein NZ960_04485 [Candidatus Kapabacteria bacterium]|nr:hypothetical protein [Candidatus Kapabacteria bacterium]MDW8012092.1 hypothetical protein [Bacteroidota bacterium]